ncbi:MAG: hypothetical protein J5565_03850 [Muribaculaceae bacterium]|nr:hypothetical protein [Muribaculaceae bacterium]
MKKICLLIACIALSTTIWAQNDEPTAVLHHGDQMSVFTGSSAFVQAHDAAENGDVINLSAGVFTPTTITKAISVFGTGFEQNETTGTDVTVINGVIYLNVASDLLLEGISVNGNIEAQCDMENITIRKCMIEKFRSRAISNSWIYQCVFNSGIEAIIDGTIATDFHITNCLVRWVARFGMASTLYVDHCLVAGGWKEGYDTYSNTFTYTNCIFTYSKDGDYRYTGRNAQMTNCIYVSEAKVNPEAILTNCYLVALADIFIDGEDGTYSPERTYELKQPDVWVGTDGTPIGPSGGMGWNKVPTTPVVKNLQLNVVGRTLNVNYEAEIR